MTNKTKNFFEVWDELNSNDSKKFKSALNLATFLSTQTKPEGFDIKETIDELNNPASLSYIYFMMIINRDTWGTYNISLIENINKDFYEKLLAIQYIAYSNKLYVDKQINLYIKDEIKNKFVPFQTKTVKKIKTIKSRLETQDKNIESIDKEAKRTAEKAENNIRKNIYTDFITILGIFTAITFAIFGGMNLLTDLFKNIGSTPASLGQTLILAAIFGLIMWGITLLLFYWISTIQKKQPKSFYKNWGFWLNALFILLIAGILSIGILLLTKTIK